MTIFVRKLWISIVSYERAIIDLELVSLEAVYFGNNILYFADAEREAGSNVERFVLRERRSRGD